MFAIEHATATAGAGPGGTSQDRARVYRTSGGVLVALADGAGGTARGARAAQAIVDAAASPDALRDPCALLATVDRDVARLGRGESTAVLVAIRGGVIGGASAGDSGAWLVDADDTVELTAGQARKPFVGAGCTPTAIPPTPLGARTLLVASDGLLRYARHADIARAARIADLSLAVHVLVELVRMPSGALHDDVTVVLCRAARRDGQ